MAEDFPATGICGGAWWNSPKSVISPAEICLSPCSLGFGAGLISPNCFGSPDMRSKLSCTDNLSLCGNNSIAFGQKLQREADSDSGGSTVTIDSTLQMMGLGFSTSSSSSDWNQTILQEDLNSSLMGSTSQDHCHGFLSVTSPYGYNNPSSSSSSPSPSSSLFQSFYETESNPSLMNNDNNLMMSLTSCSEDPQLSWSKTEPFLKQMSSSMIPSSNQQTNYGFNLSSNTKTPFWSPSNTNLNSIRSSNSFVTSPLISTRFEEKPLSCHSNITPKRSSCGEAVKKGSNEAAATKKPRITTPSQLPTFKVRKENLRDQITALQQLVSPFGKTDTASVLQEAIEYIKFLHDQVNVLCTPYLKQQQQFSEKPKDLDQGEVDNQDLKGRGLCLVPISSTFPVTNETTVDFWTPTFGGNNFR